MVNNVYETSKRIKIQWLEEEKENEYKHSFVDWIQPQTIITTVSVIKQENDFYKIEDSDITRIKSLLDQAIKHGGIELENDEKSSSNESEIDDSSSEREVESKKRTNTDEIQNKSKMRKIIPPVSDNSNSDIESSKQIELKQTDPYTFDDDRSSGSSSINNKNKKTEVVSECKSVKIKQIVTPKPQSSSSITITPSTNTKTHLENIRDKVIANIKKHEQITKQQTSN